MALYISQGFLEVRRLDLSWHSAVGFLSAVVCVTNYFIIPQFTICS